jgi:aryl-alcohol dehydrogenase-like predicted oxidoreductase
VGLAWLLRRPGITAPIIGASKAGHFDDAIAALKLELTDADVAALEAPYLPHAVVGFE